MNDALPSAPPADSFQHLTPSFSSASDCTYLPQFRSLIFPGNFVSFSSVEQGVETERNGRILEFIDHPPPLSPTIKLQLFILPSDIPTECRNKIGGARHEYLQHVPELIETDKTLQINKKNISTHIYLLPEDEITSLESTFHPKGMKHYYFIRYRYSYHLNM